MSVSVVANSGGPGLVVTRDADLDNTAQQVKDGRGRLYGWHVQNPNTTDAWVQFYDVAAAAVVVGTTVPKMSLVVPANGAIESVFTVPFEFSTAITWAATTTAAGGTDPTTGLVANAFHR